MCKGETQYLRTNGVDADAALVEVIVPGCGPGHADEGVAGDSVVCHAVKAVLAQHARDVDDGGAVVQDTPHLAGEFKGAQHVLGHGLVEEIPGGLPDRVGYANALIVGGPFVSSRTVTRSSFSSGTGWRQKH